MSGTGLRASLLALVLLPVAVWRCTPFHGDDSGGTAADGGVVAKDEGGSQGTDGSVAVDGGDVLVAVDGGPAQSCLVASNPGNVTFTVAPATPHVNEVIKVQARGAITMGNITSATLTLCTPGGPITVPLYSDGPLTPGEYGFDFVVEAGIPTLGVTRASFATNASIGLAGTTDINVIP